MKILSMIKAVFWDFDGTLMESEHVYRMAIDEIAYNYVLEVCTDAPLPPGISSKATFEFFYACELKKNPAHWDLYPEWIKKITERVADMMEEHCRPRLDSLEVWAYFHEQQIPQYIVTNSEHYFVNRGVHFLKIHDQVAGIVSGSDVKNPKPHSEPYQKALDMSGVKAEEAIVIEDSPTGVKSAKSLAILTVGTSVLDNAQLPEADYFHKKLEKEFFVKLLNGKKM